MVLLVIIVKLTTVLDSTESGVCVEVVVFIDEYSSLPEASVVVSDVVVCSVVCSVV